MDRSAAQILDPNTPFLTDQAAQALCGALEASGYRALFVGGCVRNAILGRPASDIDLSTDARPQDVISTVERAGFRAVPTGIDHGTVTVIVDGKPFEVTTFRRDVATDGRRAVVAFSDDITDDARRRDFTMNAIYADSLGAIVDPLGGLSDVRAGRVRFIEDSGRRIREDYLRILRFFRFHAYYANPELGWDVDALAGIAENLDGLDTLSAERVGAEVIKLLSAPDPAPALAVMAQTGVLGRILPGADSNLIAPLVHTEQSLKAKADPMTRLAALGGVDVADRLRLSRADQKRLEMILDQSTSMSSPKAIGYLVGSDAGLGAILLNSAIFGRMPDPSIKDDITQGASAKFPVKASDLPDLEGSDLGRRLARMKDDWLASNMTKTKNDLLKS